METPDMKNPPFFIKAVLFRLEPTPALLTASQYLISKDLRLGIISRLDAKTIRRNLRDCGFVNEANMAVVISRPAFPLSFKDRRVNKMKYDDENRGPLSFRLPGRRNAEAHPFRFAACGGSANKRPVDWAGSPLF